MTAGVEDATEMCRLTVLPEIYRLRFAPVAKSTQQNVCLAEGFRPKGSNRAALSPRETQEDA